MKTQPKFQKKKITQNDPNKETIKLADLDTLSRLLLFLQSHILHVTYYTSLKPRQTVAEHLTGQHRHTLATLALLSIDSTWYSSCSFSL